MTSARLAICVLMRSTALAMATLIASPVYALATDETPSATPAANELTEIIVTAQKRSERLQDVPITITAVDSKRMEQSGVQKVGDLAQVVPALRMDYSSAAAQPSIRGVGSSVAGGATGSAVGIYVDGYYQPSLFSSDFDLLNVLSIQVLKGPQGTLFGRNTTAGAILVTTRDPSVDSRLMGQLSYARFDAIDGQVYGSTGLSDKVAVDFAALYRRGDGYLRNIVTGNDKAGGYEDNSFRTGIKVDLDDTGRNSIVLRYAHTNTDDPTYAALTVRDGLSIGSVIPGVTVATRRGQVSSTDDTVFTAKTDAGYATGRFDLGFADLTSYTMYRRETSGEGIDFDGTPFPALYARFVSEENTFTQEFNLNSKPGGPLNWVAGAYYYRDRVFFPSFKTAVFGGPLTDIWHTLNTVTSYAVFADATYKVVDHLYLTEGVRYSHEHNNAYYDLLVPDAQSQQAAGLYPTEKSWQSVTPRSVIRYEFDPSSSLYASFTKGFKAGFINANGLTTEPVEPEKITAFEVGYKYSSGSKRISLSAFHYDYSDLQVATYNGTQSVVTNAAKSTLYGAELELATKLTEKLSLSVGGAYTHSQYDEYPGAPRFNQVLDPTNPFFGTFAATSVNASGNVMQRAPKFSGDVGLDYVIPVAGGSLALDANYAYQSKFYFDPANQFEQDGYGLLNLKATWTDPTEHWSFSIFGRNVTDETYTRSVFPTPFAILQMYGEPATYGVSIAFKF
jgi:iron complex outermembrane receptor protein